LPVHVACRVTLVLTEGVAWDDTSTQDGGAAAAIQLTLTDAGRPVPVALLATTE
jgi:hypothetical protein